MNTFTAKNVMKRFMKLLADKYSNDMEWKRRFMSDDGAATEELIAEACSALKVKPDDYVKTVIGNKELIMLQKKGINDVVLGPIGTHGIESKGVNG